MATVVLDKSALLAQYNSSQPLYARLEDEVQFILNEHLKDAKIPIHAIEHRIKSFDSIIKKAERDEQADPINQLNDILGFRIISLFLSDIDRIFALLRKNFKIIDVDDKRITKGENVFGYLSVHLIAALPPSYKGPRYNGLKSLRFEIQVRTISMHAWSIISHYLDYKTPHAVPSDLKRDFNALSGLFYVADQHFELFFKSSKISRKKASVVVERQKETSDTEINFDTLSAYLKKEFPQRQHSSAEEIGSLIEQMNQVGIKSINVLAEKLQLGANAFAAYEQKHPPFVKQGAELQTGKFKDVGVVRVTLKIVDEDFRKLFESTTPQKFEEFKPLVKVK
jgi:GTP pyrophosphokinase